MTNPCGSAPTGMVAAIEFVAVSMTDSVPPRQFETYRLAPSGVIAKS